MNIKTGKQLESALVENGANALWIKGRGLIIMSAYYGTDVAVQGNYPVYTMAQGLEYFKELRNTTTTNNDPEAWERTCLDGFAPRQYYRVR